MKILIYSIDENNINDSTKLNKLQYPIIASCNWREAPTFLFLQLQLKGCSNTLFFHLRMEGCYNPLFNTYATTAGDYNSLYFS